MTRTVEELRLLRNIHDAACDVRLAETDKEFASLNGGLIGLRQDLRSKLDTYHSWLDEGVDCRASPV